MHFDREPTLDDLLSELIVRKVMKADGYTPDDIRRLLHRAGARKPFAEVLKSNKGDFVPKRLPAMPISTHSASCPPPA